MQPKDLETILVITMVTSKHLYKMEKFQHVLQEPSLNFELHKVFSVPTDSQAPYFTPMFLTALPYPCFQYTDWESLLLTVPSFSKCVTLSSLQHSQLISVLSLLLHLSCPGYVTDSEVSAHPKWALSRVLSKAIFSPLLNAYSGQFH